MMPPLIADGVAAVLMAPQADAALPAFAPVAGRAYRFRTEQERAGAGSTRRFAVERQVTFRREGAGWSATLATTSVTGTATDESAAMFERAFAGLRDRILVFRLDASGRVIGLDDLAGTWAALCDGIAASAGAGRPDEERAAIAARLAAPLRAMPVDRQVAMLASILSPAIGRDVIERGVHAVASIRQPGKPPFGAGTTLTGTERTWRGADGTMTHESAVEGEVAVPSANGAAGTITGSGHIAVQLVRQVDTATGLLRRSTESTRTTIAGETLTRTTTVTLDPVG